MKEGIDLELHVDSSIIDLEKQVNDHVQTIVKLQEENLVLREENVVLQKYAHLENQRGMLGLAGQ
jgi:hypothetical protein